MMCVALSPCYMHIAIIALLNLPLRIGVYGFKGEAHLLFRKTPVVAYKCIVL